MNGKYDRSAPSGCFSGGHTPQHNIASDSPNLKWWAFIAFGAALIGLPVVEAFFR